MSAIGFFEDLASRFDQEAIEAIPGYQEFWCTVEAWLRLRFPENADLGGKPYLSVLHLGCATGKGLEVVRNALGAHRVDLHGVDGSESMLALARKRVPEARFARYDLENGLPISVVPYDIVFLCWTLQFLSNRDEILSQTIGFCNRPGWLFLAEKHAQTDVQRIGYQLWRRRTQTAWYIANKTAHLCEIMKSERESEVFCKILGIEPNARVHPIGSMFAFNSWLIELPVKNDES